MTRLEDITVGSLVRGIAVNENVTIIATQWYGTAVLEVTYKNARGQLGSQLLMRDNEPELEILGIICLGVLTQIQKK